MPVLSVGADANLSCTIRSCGVPFNIDWFFYEDELTNLRITSNTTPVENSSIAVNESVSVATVNVGGYNNDTSQMCIVEYNGSELDSQIFDFMLQSKCHHL